MQRVAFHNVSKRFFMNAGRKHLRGHLEDLLRPAPRRSFYALRHISFSVSEGESLAIMGANGAGKSTLLNLATRLCPPDEGEVVVNGRLSAVLELGAGFHHDLTGEENLRLNASLSGLSRKRTRELFDEIVDFSGVREFISQPLRTYSAGMIMRLAFSVAINVDPDILVIDEALAVGDQEFHAKCFERMLAFRKSGKTMLVVSHGPDTLRHMCDRALWLDRGRVKAQGAVEDVLERYQSHSSDPAA
ncbi:MAG TPA: ABC transporter ATP-binding protein [Bryobacteraceae bacterium]|nr:ABC transporter ATP-binding protein [Bryobacteraceae bacterium]